MTKTIAPYGTWISPVTPDLMTGQAVGLSALSVDGDDLYWLESRPYENGRSVLVRRDAKGDIADAVPAGTHVGSRVHEYGGGAYAVEQGRLVWSVRGDGSVWFQEAGVTRALSTTPGCRYADFAFDLARRRVLAVREDGRERPDDPQAAIVALALDGGAETLLVEGPDFLSSPRPSPHGDALAWIAWDHPDMPWDATRLHVATLDGEGRPNAAPPMAGTDRREALMQPRWSPDGVLHVISDRTDWWNIYRIEGDRLVPVAPVEAEIGTPPWVFAQRSYGFTTDGRILVAIVQDGLRTAAAISDGVISPLELGAVAEAPIPLGAGLVYVATPPTGPARIVIASGASATIVRHSAPDVLPPNAISIGAPIRFETRDVTGYAFFYPPLSLDHEGPPEEKPPLIVLSHGGPTSMVTNGFSYAIQWWTSRGFAVVDVNYGGSTGYGRPYRQMLDGEWGVVDVADCCAAAAHLVAEGLVDGQRLAIRGGSAGGYTTLAALTGTSLFEAGASHYGVADLMLLARDTHKFEARYLDRLIGPLPEAEALYAERSPINHLDGLDCPVIFFQGLDDKTVPPNQAAAMADAMDAAGLPVAHYTFAGEGHGFRKAETISRVLELELDFYGQVFGFEVPGLRERAIIRNVRRD
jgi:dipeptidyl aminopeptidase/acylaminoacyl peptidase